jgi:hypothetical protein
MEFIDTIWFWIALIAISGMIMAAVTNAVDTSNKTKIRVAELQAGGDYKKVADESSSLNAQVIDRLSALENRLASIEKTLTDIP